MSAWLVSEQSTSNLVSAILRYDKDDIQYSCPRLVKLLDGIVGNKAITLFREMRKMNIRSLRYRYGDEHIKVGNYVSPNSVYDKYQTVKSIHCYLYQSCENPRDTKTRLYRGLEELAAYINERIVMESDGWNKAQWC